MNTSQCAVYQVKDAPEYRNVRFRSYAKLKSEGKEVRAENYQQVYIGRIQQGETPADIKTRLQKQRPKNFKGHSIGCSDVIVLTDDGKTTAYYVDKDGFIIVSDFFQMKNSSDTKLDVDAKGYTIEGKKGTWQVIDYILMNERKWFLMEHGKPQICMLVSIAGCILNGVLDFFFVDIMRFGIQGSAVASLIVQLLTVLVQMFYFISRKTGIGFRKFSFDREINKEMILNGSSEFIGEMASAISMFMFNYVLMKYVGAEGVAAFTILGFVVYGYSMICIGFGQGISPLVSRCWGAKEKEMAFALRKTTNKMLFMIGLIIAIAFFVAGKQYAGLFGCNNKVADMVATGFKIYAVTFLTMGYNVVNSMYFTSCGDAGSSAIISTLRGIVFLLGFTLVFPAILGMTGVWLTAPCSETLTAIIAVFLIRKQTGKRKCGELNG